MSATTSAAPATASDIPSWKTRLRALGSGTGGPLIGLLVLGLALFIATPYFLTVNNLLNILDQVTILGVLALGMTFVIVTGGIDLSVGAVLALSIMVLGYTSHNLGMPLPLSIVLAVAVGGLCGLLTGLGITITKLPPFIATLAMLASARGLAEVIADRKTQIIRNQGFTDFFGAEPLGIRTEMRCTGAVHENGGGGPEIGRAHA